MPRAMLVVVAVSAALMLSACANRAPSPAAAKSADPACARVDCAKIAAVNKSAQRHGITVIWLHPPQNPAAAPGLPVP